MNSQKTLLAVGLMVMLGLVFAAAGAFAAEPPPGSAEKIVGPAMWAVGVCAPSGTSYVTTLRVKKIEDCDVDTDPQVAVLTACPTGPSDVLYYRLTEGTVFSKCSTYAPIITKVKNFVVKGDVVSFDAQIRSTP
jgi:hypothetical protein